MPQRGSRKSRSGCLGCKSRRIKCDETKPECMMCTSRRHKCPGYRQPLKWSTKHEAKLDKKVKVPLFLSNAGAESWSETTDHTSSPGLGVWKIERQVWSPNTLEGKKKNPEFTEADLWGFDGPFSGEHLSENSTDCHAGVALELDVALPDLDLEVPSFWLDEAQSLDAFSSFDTFLNSDMNFYMKIASVASPANPDRQRRLSEQPLMEKEEAETETRTPHDTNYESTSQAISQTGVRLCRSTAPQSLTHIPTFLIDYWFHTVCATWNGFDSAKNLNRTVTLETFAHSEALAYSLQSMSAAYLAEHLPHFRETSVTMTQAAVRAIRMELTRATSPCALPRQLLLSMFCIGTSACWIDPLQFGLPFLKEIKSILRTYNPLKAALSLNDQNALEFFNNSTLYWDMLCGIVGAETIGPIDTSDPSSPSLSPIAKEKDALHPWTGVSTGILVLFFESMLLCRAFRVRMTSNHQQTSQSLLAALRDIEQAKKLHQRLVCFSIPGEQEIADTEDELTPKIHLVQIAEGYRLAALAHLQQTFPDLTREREFDDGAITTDANDQVLGLGLEIIRILERIPLTSGTRCIQPLLCLTAGIILKLDIASTKPQQHTLTLLNDILSADLRSSSPPKVYDPQLNGPRRDALTSTETTRRFIEVGQGRRFVLERLNILESSLPPKPICVAKQLVQAVWAAYDGQGPCSSQVHWIDIMAQSNLRTIFG